jgi:hypothetical protein
LSESWRANVDATIARTDATRASGGVAAIAGSGTEYYLGAQVVGNGIFLPGDTVVAGLRYAQVARFSIVAADLAARFPVKGPLSTEARLRVAHREDSFGPGHQTAWRPSLRLTYEASSTIAFDAEIGLVFFTQRQADAAFVGRNEERATIVNLGYRLSF